MWVNQALSKWKYSNPSMSFTGTLSQNSKKLGRCFSCADTNPADWNSFRLTMWTFPRGQKHFREFFSFNYFVMLTHLIIAKLREMSFYTNFVNLQTNLNLAVYKPPPKPLNTVTHKRESPNQSFTDWFYSLLHLS